MREAALFLNAAITTGSATIIALMLTLMGPARNAGNAFQRALHDRILTFAWLAAASLFSVRSCCSSR